MNKPIETPDIASLAPVHNLSPRKNTHIAIVGLGYVGLPLAILAAERGYSTIGYDIDESKVETIRRGSISTITAKEKQSLENASHFTATHDAEKMRDANVYIVCVPTPVTADHVPDLKPLISATTTIARYLKREDIVVIESTINPGVCEEIVIPILEKSGLIVERDFYLAHCPERINPGDSLWSVRTIPRVMGGAGPHSLARARALYATILEGDIVPMQSLKEAEAVKMVENAFRDINIAFVNELAMSFDKAGIDLISVIRGASTKPFAFMAHVPGCGVGGHCIPVDPYYLIRYGEENGFVHTFLKAARTINNRMPQYTVHLLSQALRKRRKQLVRSTIALLGLSYKRDIADERESPAHDIRALLEKKGAIVRTFDPYVFDSSTHHTIDETLRDVDAVIIATDHSQFRSLTPFHFMKSGVDIVIDGRNCLRKEDFAKSGILYSGIGRAGL